MEKPDDEMLAEIRRRAARVPEPGDYWRGRPEAAPVCPANLLLFHRAEPADLLGHPPHQHHRFLLITSLAGEGRVGIDERVHRLAAGQCLLVFPFQLHFYSGFPGGIEWIFTSFEHPRGAALERLRDRGAWTMNRDALGYLGALVRAWETPSEEPALPLHLALWLHEWTRSATRRPPSRERRGAIRDDLVRHVNRLVFQNRHRPLSIDEIASTLGVSVSLLRKRFQEATGRSVGRHAREARLNHACELLHDTTLRIEEIAERCGYESLFAFSRAFSQAFGRSPSRYRKEGGG